MGRWDLVRVRRGLSQAVRLIEGSPTHLKQMRTVESKLIYSNINAIDPERVRFFIHFNWSGWLGGAVGLVLTHTTSKWLLTGKRPHVVDVSHQTFPLADVETSPVRMPVETLRLFLCFVQDSVELVPRTLPGSHYPHCEHEP